MLTIAAGIFKAKCLEIMNEVDQKKEEVIVTKHGRPIVKVIPASGTKKRPLFGRLRASVTFVAEDAFLPEPELWEGLHE